MVAREGEGWGWVAAAERTAAATRRLPGKGTGKGVREEAKRSRGVVRPQ